MFDDDAFARALAAPRLAHPVPAFVDSNRSVPIRAVPEHELQAGTAQWFTTFATTLDYLSACHDVDLTWLLTWTKKYWWSFLVRDTSVNDELYTPDLRYTDVTTFGRTIVGIDDFMAYNDAFFAAIPDWRYDPLPGQVYLDVTRDGVVRLVIRYLGSGHWTGPLRLYPYDDGAPAIHGTGRFVQAPALDRYHFTPDGLLAEGETLYDFLDVAQRARLLPRDDSRAFRVMTAASRLPGVMRRVTARVRRADR